MNKTITLLILLLAFSVAVWAQERDISGKVTTSDDGQAIPGVSVTVKGTNKGTSTTVNGTYVIKASTGSVLLFRSIGYQPKEVIVGKQSVVSVSLSPDDQNLTEVVVTALGIKRSEKSLGYATQALKGSDLTLTKEQNVIGSLAGKIAGVQVTGSSGASMGGTQKIKIRSVNSLTGGGQPLMVVDGTPISQTNFSGDANGVDYGNTSQDINPEDIENINVLKGPAASALYGLRGQYGVIMITTKKGAKGPKKVDISVSSAFTIDKVGNFMPLQNIYGVGNNQTFLTLTNGQKYVNGNDESWGPMMDGTPVRMFYSFYPQDPDFGKLTPFVPQPNNVKDFFETGYNLNNGISITGGGENSNFRMSYNNSYINGVIPNTWLKRNNLSLSTSLDITPKLTVGANVNYANNSGQRPTQGYQGSYTGANQWFQRNIDINRLRNYRYADGTILNWNVNPNTTTGIITNNRPSDWNNPFFDAYEVLNNDNRNRLFGDVNVSYQVLPELKLSGFLRSDMYTQNITHKEAEGGRNLSGYKIANYQGTDNNYELLAQYAKKWNDLSFNLNVGGNIYNTKYTKSEDATVGGLSAPDAYTMAASVDRPSSISFLSRKSTRSAYAMASVGYKDTYFLDASLRNDNSSALPKNDNSYWYSSVSGSFIFSQLMPSDIFSYGKLRASYAVAGADLDPFQILPVYSFGGVYAPQSGSINTLYVPDKLLNPDLKPSFGRSIEVGADLKFFKNRIGLDLTWYQQRNENQVINLAVSGASGSEKMVVNAGLIQNRGIELTLTARTVQSKFFNWDMAFNFARNKNQIKKIYGDIEVYQLDLNTYSSQTIYLNSSLGETFGNLVGPGYIKDPQTGKVFLGADNMPLFTVAKDFGSVLPQYTGGFRNTFRIWKFDLAAMIDFQKGGQFFSWSKMLSAKSGQAEETALFNDKGFNVRDAVANGGGVKVNGISSITGQEVTAYVDARTYYRTNLGTRIYDEWIYDASYIKMREISVGYNFDERLLKKTPIKSLKVALIARNPFMIWQKAPKGVDPSELSSGSAAISWIEKGELQTVRSYGVNLNLTF